MDFILYADIETAPKYKEFKDLPLLGQEAFKKKFQKRVDAGEYPDLDSIYTAEAALYAEFSKIICIGLGSIVLPKADTAGGAESIFIKAIIGEEVNMLEEFAATVQKVKPTLICAHNGKKFDFPFMGRRMLANGMALPDILNVGDAKPWEVKWKDTVTSWQFTDIKHYVSLITLAYIFNLPSPKQTLEGSQVPQAFYEGKIKDIAEYCMDDVFTLINVDRLMSNKTKIDIVHRVIKEV